MQYGAGFGRQIPVQHVRIDSYAYAPGKHVRYRIKGNSAKQRRIGQHLQRRIFHQVAQINMAFQPIIETQPECAVVFCPQLGNCVQTSPAAAVTPELQTECQGSVPPGLRSLKSGKNPAQLHRCVIHGAKRHRFLLPQHLTPHSGGIRVISRIFRDRLH